MYGQRDDCTLTAPPRAPAANAERRAPGAPGGGWGSRCLAAIFERHHQALYRYCRALLGSAQDAEDALQNAMARVVRALPGEGRELALKPWLYRITHNEAMRIGGRRRPQAPLEDAQEVAARPDSEVRETRERLGELLADLRELSERQRGALVLRELEGASFAHIASVFGGSEAAAKQTVYEARVCLADFARGRGMGCEEVTRALSDGDRRRLRGRPVRAHLRACRQCRTFEAALQRRPQELRALAPPLGAPAAAALLAKLTGGSGGGGAGGLGAATASGGAGGLGAASASGGGLASIVLPSVVLKGLAAVAVAAGAAAGVAEVVPRLPGVGGDPAAAAEGQGGSREGERGGEQEAARGGEETAPGTEEASAGDRGARDDDAPRAGARGTDPARQDGRERSGTAQTPTAPADRPSRRDAASGGSVDSGKPDSRGRGRGRRDGGSAPGGERLRPAPPARSPAPSGPGGAPRATAPSPKPDLPVPAVPSLPGAGEVAPPGVVPEPGVRPGPSG